MHIPAVQRLSLQESAFPLEASMTLRPCLECSQFPLVRDNYLASCGLASYQFKELF